MTDRDNQVITYLSDAEYSQLKEWSNETGKSMSHLLREAILEYTDKDRTARVEDKVDRVLTLLDDTEHTHTRDSVSTASGTKSVPEKARTIAKRLYENHDVPIQGKDVEIAIEDIAGGDDRTIDKYKSQLKKRGLLFQHPHSPVWTDSKQEWVGWVESCTVEKDVVEYTSEYSITTDEYDEIATEVGQ